MVSNILNTLFNQNSVYYEDFKKTREKIKGGSDSEPAVEEIEFAIESWTLDK